MAFAITLVFLFFFLYINECYSHSCVKLRCLVGFLALSFHEMAPLSNALHAVGCWWHTVHQCWWAAWHMVLFQNQPWVPNKVDIPTWLQTPVFTCRFILGVEGVEYNWCCLYLAVPSLLGHWGNISVLFISNSTTLLSNNGSPNVGAKKPCD